MKVPTWLAVVLLLLLVVGFMSWVLADWIQPVGLSKFMNAGGLTLMGLFFLGGVLAFCFSKR